ncbi:universal stress protein [Variovorax rhizosphaerae]|uniref:Universal stress protein n=1 Tax=Variovorax rhizosphaerae TaxID=1836200 RepID=A0ABU8WNP2_9BURK
MCRRILVTTDGSTLSRKVVNNAVTLAALLGAERVAATVVPRHPTGHFEGAMAFST